MPSITLEVPTGKVRKVVETVADTKSTTLELPLFFRSKSWRGTKKWRWITCWTKDKDGVLVEMLIRQDTIGDPWLSVTSKYPRELAEEFNNGLQVPCTREEFEKAFSKVSMIEMQKCVDRFNQFAQLF